MFQGADGVGVGICPQDLQGGGELLARLGVAAPPAQRLSGDGLGAGGGPGLPGCR